MNMSNQQTNMNMRLSCELRKIMALRMKESLFEMLISNNLNKLTGSTVITRYDSISITKGLFNELDLRLAYNTAIKKIGRAHV